MINFVPNDPGAGALAVREVEARPDRPPTVAGFIVAGNEPEAVYPIGSSGFVRWQARQAATLAVEAWEGALGAPLTAWAKETTDPHRLLIQPDAGQDLNAFYDRSSISFFHERTGVHVTYSGASTDVVAHETGHAILDARRPDLWDTNLIEAGGAHEAFGDVTAILTALTDDETRATLLSISPDLGAANFVEATAEDLSTGVRTVLGAQHPAAEPRHALNTFRWQLPDTLPSTGGPDVMIAEVHSIARILSGCFYDTVRGLFARSATRDSPALLAAARRAAALFWAGIGNAPEVPRFFRAIGRQMVVAAGGDSVAATVVGSAFSGHGIALGARGLLAPELALAGGAPRIHAATDSAEVSQDTIDDLRHRLGAGIDSPASVSVVDIGSTPVAKVSFRVEVPLDGLDERLDGVVCPVNVPALVGESGRSAALLQAPRAGSAPHETRHFVRTLVDNHQVDFTDDERARGRATHQISDAYGKRELNRFAYVAW